MSWDGDIDRGPAVVRRNRPARWVGGPPVRPRGCPRCGDSPPSKRMRQRLRLLV